MKPYFENDNGVIYHGDCFDIMPQLDAVDLVVTDPPYGERIDRKGKKYGDATHTSRKPVNIGWDDNIPDGKYFHEMFRVSKNQIVFGANYFWGYFRATRCFIIWDKRGSLPSVPFADVEFIWTSFDKMCRKYTVVNHGFVRDSNEPKTGHPTQKPLMLLKSMLSDFSQATDTILDPFMGSGTTLLAAQQLGRKFIGIEINEDYCKIAKQRLVQMELFT